MTYGEYIRRRDEIFEIIDCMKYMDPRRPTHKDYLQVIRALWRQYDSESK